MFSKSSWNLGSSEMTVFRNLLTTLVLFSPHSVQTSNIRGSVSSFERLISSPYSFRTRSAIAKQ